MQGFLATRNIEIQEVVNASRHRLGSQDALSLARQSKRVIVAKGKKVLSFDMKKNPPDDETLLKHLLGPTGNLRAPTVRKDKTLLVGFNEEEFAPLFQGQ
jgi:arsenate reductase-like glutaredoxin family protein